MSDTKSSVSCFKAFGCFSYAHVPKELSEKLDNKSKKCILIRYCQQSKAYRLYDLVVEKFMVSRAIKFLEDKSHSSQESEAMDSINLSLLIDKYV